jgi:hypothetical protein
MQAIRCNLFFVPQKRIFAAILAMLSIGTLLSFYISVDGGRRLMEEIVYYFVTHETFAKFFTIFYIHIIFKK